MTDEKPPLIESERIRVHYLERQREFREHPERAKLFQRAVVRIVHDFKKEARTGAFTFASDEHAPMGEGTAPAPLQYFVASLGF